MNDQLPKHLVGLGRFLSLVLRHDPAAIGLQLDANGWADIDTLLARAAAGVHFHRADNGVWLAGRVPADCLALADPPAA